MMTKEEKRAKDLIIKKLYEDGYGSNKNTGNKITYAYLLDFFDIHLTSDPRTVAYVRFDKAEITINRNLDIDQVSLIVRHEILHQYLDHMKRFEKHYKSKGKDFSKVTPLEHQLQNIAADYEISNRGYTDADKIIAKRIKLSTSQQPLEGLVTDIDHPEWVNMSMEQMYDELENSSDEVKEQLKNYLENNPQLDQPGDEDYQEIEDIERTAKALEEQAEDLKEEAKNQKGSSDSNSSNSTESSEDKKEKSNQDSSSTKSTSSSSNDSENSNSNSSEASSPEELEKRAKELKELAKKLKEASKEEKEALKDAIKRNEESPIRTKQEVKEDANLQERIKKLKELADSEEAKQSVIDITQRKILDSDIKKSEREVKKYRQGGLAGFTIAINNLIKKQTSIGRDKTWTRFNKKYAQTSLIKPGSSRSREAYKPLLNVYFDMSGSVEPYVEQTKKALNTLNQYLRQGKIKLNIKYVTTFISSNPKDMTGGGADGDLIMQDILETKPDNVVIMTDGDSNSGAASFNQVILNGGVIIICPNSSYLPEELIKKVKGRQLNQLFILDKDKVNSY